MVQLGPELAVLYIFVSTLSFHLSYFRQNLLSQFILSLLLLDAASKGRFFIFHRGKWMEMAGPGKLVSSEMGTSLR